MRGRDVDTEHLDKAGKARRLPLRQVEDKASERGRVDDRMFERTLEAAPHKPCVERVVAVLDQHGALRKSQEAAPRVLELGRADEHRPIDVVSLARIRVDRRAAVDQRVEERERAVEAKPLRPDLEDQERRIARRLDVDGDELGFGEQRLAPDLGGIDGDLLPRHQLGRAARLEIKGLGTHRASASARRAQAISSNVIARSSRTATP